MNLKRNALLLPLAAPVLAALLLGACTSVDRTPVTPVSMPAQNPIPVTNVTTPAPVVVASPPTPVVVSPSPAPVVVAPAPTSTQVVVAPTTTTTPVVVAPSSGYPKVINYAEGRYQLYGDAGSGYYWVWIPAGTTTYSPPLPPAVPRVTNVVLAPAQRQVVYPEGRYELYGDTTTGYYWAWIPNGVQPPAPPPPWRVSQHQGQ